MDKIKVMIINRDREYAAELNDILIQQGYKTQVVYDKEKLFENILNSKPDVIILDISTDDESAFEIAGELSLNFDTISIPKIAVVSPETGLDMLGIYGIRTTITKTFKPAEVLLKIRSEIA